MKKSDIRLKSRNIYLSVYGLLCLSVFIFAFILVVLDEHSSSREKRTEKTNNYHREASNNALHILFLVNKNKALIGDRGQATKGESLKVIEGYYSLSRNTMARMFVSEVSSSVENIIKVHEQYNAKEYKPLISMLKNSYEVFNKKMYEYLVKNNITEEGFGEIANPLLAVSDQIYVSHNNEYNRRRVEDVEIQINNQLQIKGLVAVLGVIGVFGVASMLGHVKRIVRNLINTQEEVESSQAKFKAMFESIPDAIIFADKELNIKMTNNAASKMFGYSSEELQKMNTSLLFVSQKNGQCQDDKCSSIFRKRNSVPYETTYRRRNGADFMGETISSEVKSGSGEEFGYLSVVRDVSERAQVEAILRSLAEGSSGLMFESFMCEVLKRLTELYECEYAFIGRLNEKDRTIETLAVRSRGELSENFIYKLEGTPCEDVLSKNNQIITEKVRELYPDDKILVEMEIESYFASPLISSDATTIGIIAIMDTRPLELDQWTEPVLGVFSTRVSLELEREIINRELVQYKSSLEDLVYQRTEQLSKARDEAEKANVSKSMFLSRMSHELRTPLNAILGFGQMLQLDSKDLSETQSLNVKEILDAGDHLLNLINEVLDLAKIESGKFDLEITEVSVNDVFKQCVSLVSQLAESKYVKIEDELYVHDYKVNADFIRLKQVLLNLLSNAIKYNRAHGKVIISSNVINSDIVRICVSDTGEGLSDNDISKLFNSFERLDALNNVEGTGIGLVITKHLIELMGGEIGVESKLGEGSTFWVELNICKGGNDG